MARWTKVKRIAVAGQAEIYLVTNAETGEQAVMKRLLRTPQLADPDAELHRFPREIRCQSSMNHRGIMPIIGFSFSADPAVLCDAACGRDVGPCIKANPDGMNPAEARRDRSRSHERR
jgi:hypothetical protein